jgi:hypothetical protein
LPKKYTHSVSSSIEHIIRPSDDRYTQQKFEAMGYLHLGLYICILHQRFYVYTWQLTAPVGPHWRLDGLSRPLSSWCCRLPERPLPWRLGLFMIDPPHPGRSASPPNPPDLSFFIKARPLPVLPVGLDDPLALPPRRPVTSGSDSDWRRRRCR